MKIKLNRNLLAFLLAGSSLLMSPAVFAQPGGGGGGGGGGGNSSSTMGTESTDDAIIKYDPETDSIIVVTDEATNDQIKAVITALDKPISQVLIKVLFLEVTHNHDSDIGVEATYTYGPASALDTVMTSFGIANETDGGIYNILDEDLEVTIRALQTVGKTEVLSRPSVLAQNNETATITVGEERPFITNSRIDDDGDTINTIEYEDIGIILEVTPHITRNGLIEMEVAPEISARSDETVAISDTADAEVISKRSAETYCTVADGKTVVIGGMMEDQNIESVDKVPLLGDIPLLGMLFRRSVTTKSKTELLIFLTPYVIETPQKHMEVSVQEFGKTQVKPEALAEPENVTKYLDGLDIPEGSIQIND